MDAQDVYSLLADIFVALDNRLAFEIDEHMAENTGMKEIVLAVMAALNGNLNPLKKIKERS